MKLILAIVQPAKLEAVKEALNKVEVFRLTIVDVQGSRQTQVINKEVLTDMPITRIGRPRPRWNSPSLLSARTSLSNGEDRCASSRTKSVSCPNKPAWSGRCL